MTIATIRHPVTNARRVMTRPTKEPMRYTSAGNEPLKKIHLQKSKEEYEERQAHDRAIAALLQEVKDNKDATKGIGACIASSALVERSRPFMVTHEEAHMLLKQMEADDVSSIDSDSGW